MLLPSNTMFAVMRPLYFKACMPNFPCSMHHCLLACWKEMEVWGKEVEVWGKEVEVCVGHVGYVLKLKKGGEEVARSKSSLLCCINC